MQTAKTILISIVLTLFIGSSIYGADVAKIGLVNFQRIFENSAAGKAAKVEINQQGKKMEEDLKTKGGELDQLKKKFEQEAVLMDKAMRETKEREFRIKVNDFKTLQKKYELEMQRIQKQIVDRLRKEVLKIVEAIGKKEGYLMIMEQRGVLYAPTSLDITDQVIQGYNEFFANNPKS
ncbi:MAG: OmpH family outer membrane protein [Desulfobacteraceae bacterium]|nr:OmpH family outer membrane protein [Desulfobacteraceae bacterium]